MNKPSNKESIFKGSRRIKPPNPPPPPSKRIDDGFGDKDGKRAMYVRPEQKPKKVCDSSDSNPSTPIGSDSIPSDLKRLLSSGICFGRLLEKDSEVKGEERVSKVREVSWPRWDHRSEWYQAHLVNEIKRLTDRGVRLDEWGPFEEHVENRPQKNLESSLKDSSLQKI